METAIHATPLLRYRLRWYAVSTARLLLRRWQGLVLASSLLASAGASLAGNVELLALPVLAVLGPEHGAAWRCACLAAQLAFAALWAGMQRAQVEGGGFMAFAGSLPFAPRERRRVDVAVLLLADSPLLLVLVAAFVLTAARHAPPAHLLLLADVGLLALLAQLAVLDRDPFGWAAVAAGCVLAAAGFATPFASSGALLSGVLAAVFILRPAGRRPASFAAAWERMRAPLHLARALLPRLAGRHAPAFQVSLAILYRERRNEAAAKALGAAVLAATGGWLVEVFERDARSFATILLAQGLIALTASGVFRGLAMAHQSSAGYVGALPLPRRWWLASDLAAVQTLALPFIAALALFAVAAGAATPGRSGAAAMSYALLLCALRAPQLASERHAVVLSAILAGGWIAATIALLN